ncbi:MAG: hypothetical protein WBD83_10365, partial [Xanthobacteraceae bacterium]
AIAVGGPSGTGLTIVAPGDPVPGTSGTDAVACGAIRLRACANAPVGVANTKPAATTTATPMRKAFTSHPDITAFLDLNHGNFKPWPARQADQAAQEYPASG